MVTPESSGFDEERTAAIVNKLSSHSSRHGTFAMIPQETGVVFVKQIEIGEQIIYKNEYLSKIQNFEVVIFTDESQNNIINREDIYESQSLEETEIDITEISAGV